MEDLRAYFKKEAPAKRPLMICELTVSIERALALAFYAKVKNASDFEPENPFGSAVNVGIRKMKIIQNSDEPAKEEEEPEKQPSKKLDKMTPKDL
jgi:hypothetical protein